MFYIHLLGTTSGITVTEGKMVSIPKKVVTRLGTNGFRSFDGRAKMSRVVDEAIKMMEAQNELGYAIYTGTISNPNLIDHYVKSEYLDLKTDLANG